ncbi:MAG: hypothetical protein LBV43_14275 [Prevotella sp.]|nr:hypothetical protein [Prevotella sp.]
MKHICSLLLFSAFFISMNAQVTIGSNIEPKSGVLLDLQEFNDATSLSGGRTTEKGFLLPRVALTTANSLIDIPEANTAATPLQYTGLTVYNVGTASAVGSGLNMWDGTKWVAAQTQQIQPATSALKTYLKYNGGASLSLLNLDVTLTALYPNWKRIKFGSDGKEFDENLEFDISTSVFTAKQDGIYNVYAQYAVDGNAILSLSVSTSLGIGVFVKNGTNNFRLAASESFANVGVGIVLLGTVNVTPPYRKAQVLLKLNAGDQVFVGAYTTLANLSLLSGTNTLFSVYQVK